MTIKRQLSVAVNNILLPFYPQDPVINKGSILLFDFKNSLCWNQSDSTLGTTDVVQNIANKSWPVASPTATINFDSTTGRMTASTSSTSLPIETTQSQLIADGTHNFAMSLWIYIPATHNAYVPIMMKGTGNNNVTTHQFAIQSGNTDSRIIKVFRPKSGETPGNTTNVYTTAALAAGIHRIGFAWYKDPAALVWKQKGITDAGSVTTLTDTFGSASSGFQVSSTYNLKFWGVNGSEAANQWPICRFYIEDLTISGNTPEQVWSTDWTAANGRFS